MKFGMAIIETDIHMQGPLQTEGFESQGLGES